MILMFMILAKLASQLQFPFESVCCYYVIEICILNL